MLLAWELVAFASPQDDMPQRVGESFLVSKGKGYNEAPDEAFHKEKMALVWIAWTAEKGEKILFAEGDGKVSFGGSYAVVYAE